MSQLLTHCMTCLSSWMLDILSRKILWETVWKTLLKAQKITSTGFPWTEWVTLSTFNKADVLHTKDTLHRNKTWHRGIWYHLKINSHLCTDLPVTTTDGNDLSLLQIRLVDQRTSQMKHTLDKLSSSPTTVQIMPPWLSKGMNHACIKLIFLEKTLVW